MATDLAQGKPLRARRMRFLRLSFCGSFSIANTSIRAHLGLTGTRIGALLSAFSLAYGVAQLPIGLLLDRLGSRAILAVGMFGGRCRR